MLYIFYTNFIPCIYHTYSVLFMWWKLYILCNSYYIYFQGQPSFVRVYKYPNFGGPNAAIANRTFFKADKVEMLWNKTGTGMLLLTTTDTSESSYYGDQGLHFMGTNGEANLVHLGKNGPVYHVEWSPKSTEFCVVYGCILDGTFSHWYKRVFGVGNDIGCYGHIIGKMILVKKILTDYVLYTVFFLFKKTLLSPMWFY